MKSKPVTYFLTVTVYFAVTDLSSFDVTVIVAVPAFNGVTTPEEDTVATLGLSDLYVTAALFKPVTLLILICAVPYFFSFATII